MSNSDTVLIEYCQTRRKSSFKNFAILNDDKMFGSKLDKFIIRLYVASPTIILLITIILSYFLKSSKMFNNSIELLITIIICFTYIYCVNYQVLKQGGPIYNLEIIRQVKSKNTKFSFWSWIILFYFMVVLGFKLYGKYFEDSIIVVYAFFFWRVEVAIDKSKNEKAKNIFDYIQNYDFIHEDALKIKLENEYSKDMQIYVLLKLCIYYGGETYKNIILGSDSYRKIIYKSEKFPISLS